MIKLLVTSALLSSLAFAQSKATVPHSGQVYGLVWALPITESSQQIPELLSPRWKTHEYSSPVLHPPTGLIFVGTSDRTMRAYGLDRKLVWMQKVGGAISSVPVVGAKYLYFGADDAFLYALESSTGQVAWKHQADAEVSNPPLLVGNHVIFSTALDTVYCIDADSGDYRWHVRHPQPLGITLFGNAAPVWARIDSAEGRRADVVAMGRADGSVAVLAVSNGRELWHSQVGKGEAFFDVDADVAVVGNLLIAAANEGGVSAMHVQNGELQWHLDESGIVKLASQSSTLVAAGSNKILGIDALNGKVMWRADYGSGNPSRPVFDGKRVLINLDKGPLIVLDASSGELLQSFGSPLGMSGQPFVNRDLVMTFSNGGTLYALSAAFGGHTQQRIDGTRWLSNR